MFHKKTTDEKTITPETDKPTDLFGGLEYSAFEEYKIILERADNPLPTDFQRIKELVSYFGITPEIAKKDIQIIRRVKELAPLVDTVSTKTQAAREAELKLKIKEDELSTISQKLQAEIGILKNEARKTDKVYRAALDARTEHNELVSKNPRAMGREWKKPQAMDTVAPVRPYYMPRPPMREVMLKTR